MNKKNPRTFAQRLIFLLLLGLILTMAAGLLNAAGNANSMTWTVLAGGGGNLNNGSTALNNSIGQPFIGKIATGNTELCNGYWCQADEVLPPPTQTPGPTPTPSGTSPENLYLPVVLR